MNTGATAATSLPDDEPAGRRRVIISALGLTQILAWGSSYYLLAVLAKPIATSTGWAYGAVIGGFSVGLLVSGLISIRVGQLIDRFGGRPVLTASSIALAAGLALLAASTNLAIYLLAWVIVGIGMGAGLYDAGFSTLGRLYGAKARSAITTLTLWGGFASTVCWPLSALLVDTVGWRGACLVYAGIHLAISLPLHIFMVPSEARRDPPPPPPRRVARPDAQTKNRTHLVILLAVLLTSGGIISATWSVHLIAILEAGGVGLAAAVALGALVGPAQVGARVVEMLGGNRYHPIWTITAATVLIAAGLILLWSGFPLPAAALIAYGAGNGIWSIARGTLPLALFGAEGYARLMGRLAMPSLIAQALSPFAAAILMQRAGAHATLTALVALGLLNVAGVAVLWALSARVREATRV
ncbi:MFS transporter [Acuticoccus kandeliae]|uniref:MFS transporter n=1 Tax=Acuticoccus kandeliae TaxID=2073160 RepID=UPI000D3E1BA4|nr:MFS transporter [Acuticoccus kandeliae]